MERVNKILGNQKYIDCTNKNFKSEKERIFCHHDLRHVIDVSRVAYILALEENISIEKDIVYAAGLLHDIGRWQEYSDGVDHATASAELAVEILRNCGFDSVEEDLICNAIRRHREKGVQKTPLDKILYRSDKISRPCMECLVVGQCKRFDDENQPKLEY